MRLSILFWTCAAGMLALSACQRAGEDMQSLEAVEAAANALDRALSAKDVAALDMLIGEDFLWVRGKGQVAGKKEFLDLFATEDLQLEPFQSSNRRWFFHGDNALLVAEGHLKGSLGGEAFIDRHRYADQWELRDGAWRFVYAQVTPIPEAE